MPAEKRPVSAGMILEETEGQAVWRSLRPEQRLRLAVVAAAIR